MSTIHSLGGLDSLRRSIDADLQMFAAEFVPDFFNAMNSFLTALDYRDPALMRSHLETARAALVESMETHTPKFVRLSAEKRTGYEAAMAGNEGRVFDWPDESLDATGRGIQSELDQLDRMMQNVRAGWLILFDGPKPPHPLIGVVDAEVHAIADLRHRLLGTWPWSHREPPPVNRTMLDESRAAYARGDRGEDVRDLIRRLGGE